MLDLSRACRVDNLCCWQCTFYILTPTHLTNACRLFDCISSFIYSPYCHMVLNADERVHSVTCVRLFLHFFLTQDFTLFHICASLFSASFPFFIVLFLYPIFTCTSFIALNLITLRASLDATISLSVSVFIRLNPRATSGFLLLICLTPPE